MNKLSSVFRGIDLYGTDFRFLIQNSNKIKTHVGALLTVLTLAFTVFAFVNFGRDFFEKLNPKVVSQDKVFSYEELIELNNRTALDRKIVIQVSKFIEPWMDFFIRRSEEFSFQMNSTYEVMEKCEEEWVLKNLYPDNHEYGKSELKKQWAVWCLSTKDFKMGLLDSEGGTGSMIVNPINIFSMPCGTSFRGKKAKECPVDKMLDITKEARVAIWTEEVLFNPDNQTNPFSSYIIAASGGFVTLNQGLITQINFKEHKNFDDTGFILPSVTNSTYLGYSRSMTLNPRSDKNPFLIHLVVGYDKKYTRYFRTYMKIQDLLALVGGIIKAVFTLVQILLYFFNSYTFYSYIFNSYYDTTVKFPHESKLELSQVNNQNSTISNKPPLNVNVDTSVNNFIAVRRKSLNNSNLETKTKNHLKINFLVYLRTLFPFCRCGNHHLGNIKQKLKEIDHKRGVEYLFSAFREIRFLKKLFLNENQVKAMNFIKKQNFCDHSVDFVNDKEKEQVEQELVKYFNNLNQNQTLSQTDLLLLENLEDSLKSRIL